MLVLPDLFIEATWSSMSQPNLAMTGSPKRRAANSSEDQPLQALPKVSALPRPGLLERVLGANMPIRFWQSLPVLPVVLCGCVRNVQMDPL